MMEILMGPTGRIIRGHVLDCNQARFEAALAAYDAQLYTKWNPKKLGGWGCWEIRRRPEFNTALDIGEIGFDIVVKVGPYENDFVHHVLDAAFLNYDQMRKLRDMDTWKHGDAEAWQAEVEYRTSVSRAAAMEKAKKYRADAARTFKNEIRAFRNFIAGGGNPHLVLAHWEKAKALE